MGIRALSKPDANFSSIVITGIDFREVFMASSISRRMFLKSGIAAGGRAGCNGLPGTQALAANDDRGYLATLIDIRKCIGCEVCVEACRDANAAKFPEPAKPFPKMYPSRVKVSDWSEKQNIADRLTPYTWLFIQHATVKIDGEDTDLTLPRRCMHCVNPPASSSAPGVLPSSWKMGLRGSMPDICLGGSRV